MKICKRIAACALAIGLVFSLAACGGDTEESITTTRNPFIFGDYTGNVVGEGAVRQIRIRRAMMSRIVRIPRMRRRITPLRSPSRRDILWPG